MATPHNHRYVEIPSLEYLSYNVLKFTFYLYWAKNFSCSSIELKRSRYKNNFYFKMRMEIIIIINNNNVNKNQLYLLRVTHTCNSITHGELYI